MSAISLLLGLLAFRWAMQRERRLGTLGVKRGNTLMTAKDT